MASGSGLPDMRQYHGPQCNGMRWSEDTEDEPKKVTRSHQPALWQRYTAVSGRLVLNTGNDLGAQRCGGDMKEVKRLED